MATLRKSNTRCHIRSVSLPTRSHPTTLQIEDKLNKLKIREVPSTSKEICNNFTNLEELYKCVHDLLNLPMTQQVISQYKKEKWVVELLDGSVRLLDTCGYTKDILSQMTDNLGQVRSCLRRRKGDSSIESGIAGFFAFRKKTKKDVKKLLVSLKQMDSEIGVSQIWNLDHHVLAVIRVLREVSAASISIFQSLLAFLSVPVSKLNNQTKWSNFSNLIRNGRVICEFDKTNELESVDASLSDLCKSGLTEVEKMQNSQNRLKALEARVEEFESCLECVFRRLIRARTTFLNIISC